MTSMWSDLFFAPSKIDEILSQEDCTLEDLLQDDEIIQAAKQHNKKLVDFLSKPENVTKMVDYILVRVPEDSSHVEKYIYPTVSFEILTAECGPIETVIFDNNYLLLSRICEFFLQERIDHIQGSHIAKVLTTLLTGFTKGMLDYLSGNPKILNAFVNHLDLFDVTSFFIKILTVEVYEDEFKEYLKEQNFLGILFSKLDEANKNKHVDITYAFLDLLHVPDAAPLFLDEVKKENVLDTLFSNLFSCNSSLYNGTQIIVGIVYSLVENQYLDYDTLPPLLQYVIRYVPQFKKVLEAEIEESKYINLPNGRIEPAGPCKVAIVRLFEALFSIQYKEIEAVLLQEDIMNLLIQIFFKYENHSILHKTIDEIFSGIVEDDYSVFVHELLVEKKFQEQIMDYYESRREIESNGVPRNSCIAFCLLFASNLFEASCIHESVQNHLISERWNDFIENVIMKKRDAEKSYLEAASDEGSVTSSLNESNNLSGTSTESEDSGDHSESDSHSSSNSEDFFLDLQDKDDIPSDNDFYEYKSTKAETLISTDEINALLAEKK